ncbi:MAG TPA: hypothetical protein VEA15_08320 [Caulobacteraceae bacterium]|nr:hypothetical protein [Caulobacteraceae bacterium]
MLLRLSDRLFFGGLALLCVAMIALALVWPQGQGARSPAPFGHEVVIPDYVKIDEKKAQARREAVAAAKRAQARATGGIQVEQATPAETTR